MIDGKKKQARKKVLSQQRVMGYEAAEQKAFEKEKIRLIRSDARKEGKKRAYETLYSELDKAKEKKEKREKIKKHLKSTGGAIAIKGVKRFVKAANVQTPKRSKSSLKGLFRRDVYTKQFGR